MPDRRSRNARQGLYARFGKRALDLALAVPAGLVALPFVLLLALCVRLALGAPVLFRQRRPGLGAEIFELRKFRTMTEARDEQGRLLPDDLRLTRLGRFMRRASLDELPEIWSVIRGHMSLVGPRPLLERYLGRYTSRQARRHEVRPGLTGWAQVNGRNAIDWNERLELDVWYVENLALGLDLRILARTAAIAVSGRGVSADGHATMPEFRSDSSPDSVVARDESAGSEREET